MNISTRFATFADLPVVYQFICELEENELGEIAFERCYRYNIANDKNCYLVAEDDGQVVGFLSCHGQMLLHHADWVYEIQELYVRNEYRSKGVGKLLLDTIIEQLKDIEYDVLEVTSNKSRTDAHRFYLKNGFKDSHFKFTKRKE